LANATGIRAVKISLAGLLVTAIFQLFVVYFSGSVALLADTVHNFSDALTALPLWLAFALASLPRNRRYTYGYGRAEDLAGVLIVLMIFGSALVVFYESIQKLIHFRPMENIGWVAAAAIIGFLGNELVALFRIRVGRQIGSAALVADGLHARTDGITSLAVLVGAIGAALGVPILDPLIGFLVGVAILVIVWGAARDMWWHIMDATDPQMVDLIADTAAGVQGVRGVQDVHLRWVGHQQRGEIHIEVDCQLSTERSHGIAEDVRCQLFNTLPSLAELSVHVDPCECKDQVDYHPSMHCLQN
jgi:cation diffusion facilitator family transporter